MKWRRVSADWIESDTAHRICKTEGGRFLAWHKWRPIGEPTTREQAVRQCEKDVKRKR